MARKKKDLEVSIEVPKETLSHRLDREMREDPLYIEWIVLFRTQAYSFDTVRNIWSETMQTIEVSQNMETKEIKVVVV